MDFSRKYFLGIFVPPIVAGAILAFAFLSQLIGLGAGHLATIAIVFLIVYGVGAILMARVILPAADAAARAVAQDSGVSEAVTECFVRTEVAGLLVWTLAGFAFAIAGTIFVMPSLLGFGYFFVAALILGGFGVPWSYFGGKLFLTAEAARAAEIRYTGREIPLGRKIAIVFIGVLIVSSAALVLLVSSRVSTELEALAIRNQTEAFQRVFDAASPLPKVDANALKLLQDYAPEGFGLYQIAPDGTVNTSSKEPLDAEDVRLIRAARSGNSLAFISPDVSIFKELPDGSILVMTIPWTPYQGIPKQIAKYAFIIVLLTVLIFSLATYLLARDATGSLRNLQELAAELARGNFGVPAKVFADDEVGDLASSFRETRENLRRLVGRIRGSGSTITDGVRVISGGTETLLGRAVDQSKLIEATSAAVENVGRGNDSVFTAAESVTELAQDASSRALELQAAAEEVAKNMEQLFVSVDKSSSSTTEMDASAREMTGRTEFLASIGEEVLSFVSEMDSTVKELLQTSQATAGLSREVREDAEVGGTAVNQTVDGIQSAQESTRRTAETLGDLQQKIGEISQILTVIEEVTERTNLLSLNAAIIAAQAGEHGLGFSVVAEEIRELADRTRGSTKEIGGIIKAVQTASREATDAMHEGVETVDHNVNLAQNASESLRKILHSASRSYDMATKMTSALEEQAVASQRLHEVTSRMSDHIAEINRATQEQARGTRLLADESERVRDIALQVKNSTDEQSVAGTGISRAMEQIASDIRSIRDLLQQQRDETERISTAAQSMLEIAQENQGIAKEFTETVNNLSSSAREFEAEVNRFKME